MQHTIDIPKPLFAIGDVVEMRHQYGSLYLHVIQVRSEGRWEVEEQDGGPKSRAWMTNSQYTTVVQAGSVCRNENLAPLRPGTILGFPWDRLHTDAKKVPWAKPVTTLDTQENVFGRQEEWERRKGLATAAR